MLHMTAALLTNRGPWRSQANTGSHVGAKVSFAPFSFAKETSARCLAPPSPQKVALASPARLQARSPRLRFATNFLWVAAQTVFSSVLF